MCFTLCDGTKQDCDVMVVCIGRCWPTPAMHCPLAIVTVLHFGVCLNSSQFKYNSAVSQKTYREARQGKHERQVWCEVPACFETIKFIGQCHMMTGQQSTWVKENQETSLHIAVRFPWAFSSCAPTSSMQISYRQEALLAKLIRKMVSLSGVPFVAQFLLYGTPPPPGPIIC